jgi:CRP-like cAMP-binding protein
MLELNATSRTYRAGQEIISEGGKLASPFILVEGVAIRYRILRDGQRQVLSVILPGDFAGYPSCFFETALYSIRTLTAATTMSVSMSRLIALFDTHPLVAAEWFWKFACELSIYTERLITISRRPAAERVAHFLLELFTRLQQIGLAKGHSFCLPLTQSIVSDALGLSIPYVNRVLHQLREDGLMHIKDQIVFIDNLEELAALADFEKAYLKPLSIEDFRRQPA